MKILIPEVSPQYLEALSEYLQSNPDKGFEPLLNIVSGYAQSVDISVYMGGLGGAKTIPELLSSTTGFEHATLKEIIKFHEEGYTASDFQHIFLDAYLRIKWNIKLELLHKTKN